MRRPIALVAVLAILSSTLAMPARPAYAATITVNSTSFTVAFGDNQCTLIEAMENARNANGGYPDCAAGSADSNVIQLQQGQTYAVPRANTNPGTPSAVGLPFVTRPLTINGNGSTITRTGDSGAFRLLYVVNSSLILNDLTVSNIFLPEQADGAVYNDNGTLTINRSTFIGMRGGGTGGGAVTSRAINGARATLSVNNSAFHDNESRSTSSAYGAGAGINTFAHRSGSVNTATISASRFHDNTATNQGAGISNAAYDPGATSTITIDQSSVTGNTTTGGTTPAFGGGIANFTGRVETNLATNSAANMTIRNSTISGNTAADSNAGAGFGGGIFHEVDCGFQQPCGGVANLTLEHVTIFGNRAGRGPDFVPERGGGIWSNNNSQGSSVSLLFRNSIVAGNNAGGVSNDCRDVTNTISSQNYNIDSDGSCRLNTVSLQQLNLAPLDFSQQTYFHTPQQGSAAIDRATCILNFDQIGRQRPQGNACDVGAIEAVSSPPPPPPRRQVPSDFNGGGRSDPGIFRTFQRQTAQWYSVPSGGGQAFSIYFGQSGDIPVPADYNGDGRTDAAIFRPSTGLWYGVNSANGQILMQFILGQNGDIPVPCDYDGDGDVDPAIFRPSDGLWHATRREGSLLLTTRLGGSADTAVPEDYNRDGRCDPTIMRAGGGPNGTNLWYAPNLNGGPPIFQIYFGQVGDIAAPGDYDGDARADAVIFRPSTGLWYGPSSATGQIVVQFFLGTNGDRPIPGDYDGNGRTDAAVFTPPTGRFFGVAADGRTVVLDTNLGAAPGDVPTAKRPGYAGAYPYGPEQGAPADDEGEEGDEGDE